MNVESWRLIVIATKLSAVALATASVAALGVFVAAGIVVLDLQDAAAAGVAAAIGAGIAAWAAIAAATLQTNAAKAQADALSYTLLQERLILIRQDAEVALKARVSMFLHTKEVDLGTMYTIDGYYHAMTSTESIRNTAAEWREISDDIRVSSRRYPLGSVENDARIDAIRALYHAGRLIEDAASKMYYEPIQNHEELSAVFRERLKEISEACVKFGAPLDDLYGAILREEQEVSNAMPKIIPSISRADNDGSSRLIREEH